MRFGFLICAAVLGGGCSGPARVIEVPAVVRPVSAAGVQRGAKANSEALRKVEGASGRISQKVDRVLAEAGEDGEQMRGLQAQMDEAVRRGMASQHDLENLSLSLGLVLAEQGETVAAAAEAKEEAAQLRADVELARATEDALQEQVSLLLDDIEAKNEEAAELRGAVMETARELEKEQGRAQQAKGVVAVLWKVSAGLGVLVAILGLLIYSKVKLGVFTGGLLG